MNETEKCAVLAVDDDTLVLLNTVMMLEELGHKVFEAESGNQALEVLHREPSIGLVVTDLAMPEMNGIELFARARQHFPDVRFILASGYGEDSDFDEPALHRLSKPFWLSGLARAIDKAMGAAPLTPISDR